MSMKKLITFVCNMLANQSGEAITESILVTVFMTISLISFLFLLEIMLPGILNALPSMVY